MYKLLQDAAMGNLMSLPFLDSWEVDLDRKFSEAERNKIIKMSHSSSISLKYQGNGYKIVCRWYYTPKKIHKF